MKNKMKNIKIENRMIGESYPTFIIAEVGYNFENIEQAKKSIDEAVKAGADAVKFQTFRADTITTKDIMFPEEAGGGSQYEEFKKYELSEEAHHELFDYAKTKGIIAFSTPSHRSDVELLEKLNVPLYKVGSDDLTNLPFLEYIAKKGKPMIVSTGMATLEEVDRAVSTILATGNDNLVLLHCVSNYPAYNLETVNLKAIQTMEQVFQLPIGFSDHTTSLSIPVAAVALGAVMIERHFTIDKNLPVPDASFSTDPEELKQIITGIREVEKAMGNGVKQPADTEWKMRSDARKSIIAIRDIKAGTIITEDMIDIKRPSFGLEPQFLDIVIGRKAQVNIKKDEPITWDKI